MLYIFRTFYIELSSWGPRCKPQTDYKPREGEKRDCIPYVRSMPVKRERRIVTRRGTPESSTERTDNFIQYSTKNVNKSESHRPRKGDPKRGIQPTNHLMFTVCSCSSNLKVNICPHPPVRIPLLGGGESMVLPRGLEEPRELAMMIANVHMKYCFC